MNISVSSLCPQGGKHQDLPPLLKGIAKNLVGTKRAPAPQSVSKCQFKWCDDLLGDLFFLRGLLSVQFTSLCRQGFVSREVFMDQPLGPWVKRRLKNGIFFWPGQKGRDVKGEAYKQRKRSCWMVISYSQRKFSWETSELRRFKNAVTVQ